MSDGAYPHPELASDTIDVFRSRLESGEITARSLAEMHLERITAVDRSGPHLRAVIELNPEALEIAEELDQERRNGKARGPLHGIPVLIKDNIDTGDQMLTTAGSLALTAATAPVDAPLVARLREAGMVLLGKTNLSEWANFRSTRSTSGWSGRGRQTSNPYVLDRSPAGSSAGSAVAVSAGLVPVAVGTETDGSIISPSSVTGVVGFKPAVGRISQRGIIPISASQDTAGPHARCVRDAAALYECLAGLTLDPAIFNAGALKGRRVGVTRPPPTGQSEHVDRVYEEALAGLREAGAELVDPVEVPGQGELRSSEIERTILLHEFKAGLNSYLQGRGGVGIRSLKELIEFNLQHAAEEMPYFRQELFELAEATSGLDNPDYQNALASARRLSREQGIDAALSTSGVDVLVSPSGPPAWVIDRINGDRNPGGFSQLAAVAGYPNVTVPAGFVLGELPIGLSLFARPDREADLLGMAYAFEQATHARRPPSYRSALALP